LAPGPNSIPLYKLTEAQAISNATAPLSVSSLFPIHNRLCLMNLMLHGIESQVENGDSLSPDGERLRKVKSAPN
jgi:type I restriction enzyme M protein